MSNALLPDEENEDLSAAAVAVKLKSVIPEETLKECDELYSVTPLISATAGLPIRQPHRK